MFSNVFIDRTRNAARGSTHDAAAKDVAIVKSCVLALVSLAFKLSQLAMPKVSTYTRTRIELLLTIVSFRHVIIIHLIAKRLVPSLQLPSIILMFGRSFYRAKT